RLHSNARGRARPERGHGGRGAAGGPGSQRRGGGAAPAGLPRRAVPDAARRLRGGAGRPGAAAAVRGGGDGPGAGARRGGALHPPHGGLRAAHQPGRHPPLLPQRLQQPAPGPAAAPRRARRPPLGAALQPGAGPRGARPRRRPPPGLRRGFPPGGAAPGRPQRPLPPPAQRHGAGGRGAPLRRAARPRQRHRPPRHHLQGRPAGARHPQPATRRPPAARRRRRLAAAALPLPLPRRPAAAAADSRPSGPTTPRWSLRHRSYVDLQDYRYCRDAAPSPVPRELVLTVELPLLRCAAQAALEIRGRQLRLDSQRPAYRLRLRLPYAVDEGAGRAAFNKAKRQLLVTLPVVPPPPPPAVGGAERPSEAPEEPVAEEGSGDAAPPPAPAPGPGGAAPSTCDLGDPPPDPPESQAPPAAPGDMALSLGCAASSPGAALCPPFQCRQDEASVTLLLQVPGILPQSLRGDLGAHHYHLRFSTCAGAYTLFLQFSPENSLAPAEASVDVSAHNAAITLAKAPGSTGLWEKLCFGLDASALQERLFVSEENVDRFLGTVLCPSFCKESVPESQPLIEVLDVTEDKSQIRLQQPQEAARSEQGGKAQTVNGPGGDCAEKRNDADLQPETETNCAAADTVEEQHATETTATSTSFVPAETIGKIGCSSHHCLQLEPSDTSSAIPGKAKGSEPDVDCAFTTGETAVSADSDKQAGLRSEGQAKTKGGDVAACAEPAQANQRGSDCRPASPVLREVDAQDGSVRVIRDHTTRCAVTFQNSLLYELD
uniref:Dynein axonemal assembly factor 2 n=1 Tax=Apteryx owenii TaxID=8824 RepID=A0A8B9P4U2_APTOW